uniref:UDENN domain-containing protein n=1 Tax=Macrostomum lignano TaxID=282301 RepID=A0A1I8FJT9_9PLAT
GLPTPTSQRPPPLLASPPPALPRNPKRPVKRRNSRTHQRRRPTRAHRPLHPAPADPALTLARNPVRRRARRRRLAVKRRWRGRRQTASPSAETTPGAGGQRTKMGAGMSQIFRGQPAENSTQLPSGRTRAGCDLVFVGANEGLYYICMSLDQRCTTHHGAVLLCAPALPLAVRVPRHPGVPLWRGTPQLYRHDLAQLFPADAKSSKLKGRVAMRLANNPPSAKIPRTQRLYAGVGAEAPGDRRALAGLRPAAVRAAAPVGTNARRTFLEFKSLPCPDRAAAAHLRAAHSKRLQTALRLCRRPARPERRLCPVSPAGPQQAGRPDSSCRPTMKRAGRRGQVLPRRRGGAGRRGPRPTFYRFVGFAGQNPVMERRPADDPMASCDLMLIIGHVSA